MQQRRPAFERHHTLASRSAGFLSEDLIGLRVTARCTDTLSGQEGCRSKVESPLKATPGANYYRLQDWPGRTGYWNVGVPPSGPMDALAFRLANALVGNGDDAAGLEFAITGPTLRFHSPTTVRTQLLIHADLHPHVPQNMSMVQECMPRRALLPECVHLTSLHVITRRTSHLTQCASIIALHRMRREVYDG